MEEQDFPHFEVFKEHVKNVWLDGDLQSAYKKLRQIVLFDLEADELGITYHFIMDKWGLSIDAWSKEYGDTEAKYIGKEAKAKKRNIEKFLDDKAYLLEFSLDEVGHERDNYLFPEWLTLDEQLRIIEDIEKILDDRREGIKSGKITS